MSMSTCIACIHLTPYFERHTREAIVPPPGRFNLVYAVFCVTIPPAVRPTHSRQMATGSLTCAHIWVHAVQYTQRLVCFIAYDCGEPYQDGAA